MLQPFVARKRQLDVAMVEWSGERTDLDELNAWVETHGVLISPCRLVVDGNGEHLAVVGRGGIATIDQGDFVALDAHGYPYPLDRALFVDTYDVVADDDTTAVEVTEERSASDDVTVTRHQPDDDDDDDDGGTAVPVEPTPDAGGPSAEARPDSGVITSSGLR